MSEKYRIVLPEKFSFEHYEWFRNEYMEALMSSKPVELVCNQVAFLDSAALGMIASLQKNLKGATDFDLFVSSPSNYCDEFFQLANMYGKYIHLQPSI
ncbi:hypothetical protein MAQ5080_00751 [Marinomonas aquimarina]|uniref:STAS domain-containing protein n=1 Tax=Marinomonas aquimarina TaxID=295068 RepID=A0A1A8T6D5_9GAMM|nr:STAS domain-containing protein [Marinomonas aquimarina]SBS27238.1 hypothetical protein MAQ5080_00751 [Marinomonas aquimarina]